MNESTNEADIIFDKNNYTFDELAQICGISIQGMHQYIKNNAEKINAGETHIWREKGRSVIDKQGAAIVYQLRKESTRTKYQTDSKIYEDVPEAEVLQNEENQINDKTVITAVEQMGENMSTQLVALNNNLVSVKNENSLLRNENKELQERNTALQVTNAELTKDLQHQQELQKRDIAEKNKEISSINSQLDFAKSQINLYKEKAETSEKDKSTLNQSIESLTKEKEQLQQQNTVLSSDKNRNSMIWIAALIVSILFACGLGYMLGYITTK